MLQAVDEKSIVFGLDIGTRSIVGTVGYKVGDNFRVLAQSIKPHDTRAMIDGQIHDISEVGKSILEVKTDLEHQLGIHLYEVCIAAAGRVLKTISVHMEHEFEEDTVVTSEHLHTMDLLGVDQAQKILNDENDTNFEFYSVGYSTINYFANDDKMSTILGHKVRKMSEDMIVTFLPDDVVDGLYSAVNMAGLEVVNMTLEPIAAINIAIPKSFRMLNIALVDVGAGTSDISITRDGSIIAYGMIPQAGDELTEVLVQKYLVDFDTAEHMKITSGKEKNVEFKDILQIPHMVTSQEVLDILKPVMERMTSDVAEKIKELNGGKSVSAVFVVGGGGKVLGYTEMLAEKLDLISERVALRGEEVLNGVQFESPNMVRDSLMVTPIGICLSAYEKKNNFIIVYFNGERMKLYDNDKLTIMDAAVQAGFPNIDLFPKSGKELRFTVNGKQRLIRGGAGEAAVITMDGKEVSLNEPLVENARIEISPSTEGEPAHYTIGNLEDFVKSSLSFTVNGRMVLCPKFARANGNLVSEFYSIQNFDVVELVDHYTVRQLIEFMDVEVDLAREILVNNKDADFDTEVYENFAVDWTTINYISHDEDVERDKAEREAEAALRAAAKATQEEEPLDEPDDFVDTLGNEEVDTLSDIRPHIPNKDIKPHIPGLNRQAESLFKEAEFKTDASSNEPKEEPGDAADADAGNIANGINVTINGQKMKLTGKDYYIYVDIFDAIKFDLTAGRGRSVVTRLNGKDAQYTEILSEGDVIDVYWE